MNLEPTMSYETEVEWRFRLIRTLSDEIAAAKIDLLNSELWRDPILAALLEKLDDADPRTNDNHRAHIRRMITLQFKTTIVTQRIENGQVDQDFYSSVLVAIESELKESNPFGDQASMPRPWQDAQLDILNLQLVDDAMYEIADDFVTPIYYGPGMTIPVSW